ncbi:MAG: MoaD/ThiS family protein [Clostridia bacterium]|jgi:molybdopterin converting factor small subunit|nr:MoaD/ThiS family protein [Clostridia bacterium]
MAKINVKLFGVFRMDTHIDCIELEAAKLGEIFPLLNEKSLALYEERHASDPKTEKPAPFTFKDAIVYVNGERSAKKGLKLADGDEIWLLSPASGG